MTISKLYLSSKRQKIHKINIKKNKSSACSRIVFSNSIKAPKRLRTLSTVPLYIPAPSGYARIILEWMQAGSWTLMSLPRYPQHHRTTFLYATYRYFLQNINWKIQCICNHMFVEHTIFTFSECKKKYRVYGK